MAAEVSCVRLAAFIIRIDAHPARDLSLRMATKCAAWRRQHEKQRHDQRFQNQHINGCTTMRTH